MSQQWKSAFLWFFGVVGAGVTVLSLAVVMVGFVHHVSFDILSGAVYTWVAVFFIVAVVPIPMVLFGVADDRCMQECAEMGKAMLLYYNIVAWIGWAVAVFLAFLFMLAFLDELVGPYDDAGQDPLPVSIYRRVWKQIKDFVLTVLIIVLPNKDGEVPD